MRGVKGMICDTSSVTGDAGLHVRGHHILDLVHIKPEEVLYLMLVGELPNKEELKASGFLAKMSAISAITDIAKDSEILHSSSDEIQEEELEDFIRENS